MIDWLTCRIPVNLPEPIKGGETVKLDRDGKVLLATPHRLMVEGSFSSTLSIRAPSTCELEVSGNLAKWLAGHNLYGTDCPASLLWAVLRRLEGTPGVFPWSLASVGLEGPHCLADTILTRVDCTGMLQLGSLDQVKAFIRSAALTGTLSHRGRGVMREGTLVFGDAKGKTFARNQIVMYAKGQEIQVHKLPQMMMEDAEVIAWVNQCLRVEVRLGRLDLQEQSLRRLGNWCEGIALQVWETVMAKLTFSEVDQNFDLNTLPRKYRGTYAMWEIGRDCRQLLSNGTYYRHRHAILELTGIDISVPPAPRQPSNVVPLADVLGASWAKRPAWADRVEGGLRDGGAIVLPFAA